MGCGLYNMVEMVRMVFRFIYITFWIIGAIVVYIISSYCKIDQMYGNQNMNLWYLEFLYIFDDGIIMGIN